MLYRKAFEALEALVTLMQLGKLRRDERERWVIDTGLIEDPTDNAMLVDDVRLPYDPAEDGVIIHPAYVAWCKWCVDHNTYTEFDTWIRFSLPEKTRGHVNNLLGVLIK